MRIPIVAIGFMYTKGYLHQQIREDGWQENIDEPLERDAAPISRVLNEDGTQLIVKIPPHESVYKEQCGQIFSTPNGEGLH